MIISLILPTRNRPNNIKRLFDSIIATADDLSTLEVSLRVDDDDSESLIAAEAYKEKFNISPCILPRTKNFGELWNSAWKNATGDIFFMANDDLIFRTKSWDTEIKKEFDKVRDKILFVFGNDGLQRGGLGTHAFIHRNWTNVLGYFAAPCFNVFYHDTWNDAIARGLNRRIYRSDIFIEHMHESAGKAVADDVTRNMITLSAGDGEIWNNTKNEREDEILKLRRFIETVG